MKLKKPNGKTGRSAAILAVSALVGGMASRGVFGLIHTPTDPAAGSIKKEHETLKRIALAGAGVAAMLYAPDGSEGDAMKGAGLGLIIDQGNALITTAATKSGITGEAASTTASKKFIARMVGLGCPCDSLNGLGNPYPTIEHYAMYTDVPQDSYAPAASSNSFTDHPIFKAVQQHAA